MTDPELMESLKTKKADPDPLKSGYLSRTSDMGGNYSDPIDDHVVARVETESAVKVTGKNASCETEPDDPKKVTL